MHYTSGIYKKGRSAPKAYSNDPQQSRQVQGSNPRDPSDHTPVDAYYNKKYKLDKSENFDEFMKALGVGLVTRKMGNAVSPVVELKQEGDEYLLSSNSTFKNVTTKFKLGVQMDDETPDGRKVKSTFTLDGATLHEKQIGADGKETSIDRVFSADEIKMVCKVDDIVCTRIYKLQA